MAHGYRWQTTKCLGCGHCCREIFLEVLYVGGARAKSAVFSVSYAQPTGKVLLQTKGTDGMRIHSEGVPFGGHNPSYVRTSSREP